MITTPLVDGYYGGLFINRKEAVRVFFTCFLVFTCFLSFFMRDTPVCMSSYQGKLYPPSQPSSPL